MLDILVQSRRDTRAAVRLMRKLIEKQGFAPNVLVTHWLGSYGAAKRELGLLARHEQGQRKNNRAENSHQPTRRRERKMQRFDRLARPSAFCPPMLPSKTRSTPSATSFPVLGRRAREAVRGQIQFIDEHLNEANRIVHGDVIVQGSRARA